jgi:hypothetical protein
MNLQVVYLVDAGLSWFIVLLAVTGYFITLRRIREKWPFWIILAIGWAFLAASNTVVLMNIPASQPPLTAIWLSSYLLVMVSLLLLFLKLAKLMKTRNR